MKSLESCCLILSKKDCQIKFIFPGDWEHWTVFKHALSFVRSKTLGTY